MPSVGACPRYLLDLAEVAFPFLKLFSMRVFRGWPPGLVAIVESLKVLDSRYHTLYSISSHGSAGAGVLPRRFCHLPGSASSAHNTEVWKSITDFNRCIIALSDHTIYSCPDAPIEICDQFPRCNSGQDASGCADPFH